MSVKAKRKPFTDAEKDFIFTTFSKAKEEGKDIQAVKMYLADELEASAHTVYNTYNKIKKEHSLALAEGSVDIVSEVDDELVEYVHNDIQTTLEFSERVVHTEEKEEEVIASKPSVSISRELENLNTELVKVQMGVLLDRIEQLTTERDEWKNKALALEAEAVVKEAERKAIITLLNNK